mmetsp:Transcript_26176/g.62473  ORF Transcript_26176/g.62473 Transcript_26176/m.62473 type:complete len:296 (+) Transcript_26176:405-1292(+)
MALVFPDEHGHVLPPQHLHAPLEAARDALEAPHRVPLAIPVPPQPVRGRRRVLLPPPRVRHDHEPARPHQALGPGEAREASCWVVHPVEDIAHQDSVEGRARLRDWQRRWVARLEGDAAAVDLVVARRDQLRAHRALLVADVLPLSVDLHLLRGRDERLAVDADHFREVRGQRERGPPHRAPHLQHPPRLDALLLAGLHEELGEARWEAKRVHRALVEGAHVGAPPVVEGHVLLHLLGADRVARGWALPRRPVGRSLLLRHDEGRVRPRRHAETGVLVEVRAEVEPRPDRGLVAG